VLVADPYTILKSNSGNDLIVVYMVDRNESRKRLARIHMLERLIESYKQDREMMDYEDSRIRKEKTVVTRRNKTVGKS